MEINIIITDETGKLSKAEIEKIKNDFASSSDEVEKVLTETLNK